MPVSSIRSPASLVWHINADEADLIDYDTSFKLPAQDAIYAPDPYRSSDHDPVVIGLRLDTPPYLKESTRSALSAAIPTGNRQDDKFLEEAIQRIDQSLEPVWWLDDTTLDPEDGKHVFDRKHQAVVAFSKANQPVASRAIDDLVEADRRLATAQLQIAIDVGSDPKTIARAQQSLADAETYAAARKFDKAVLEYEQAWTNAIKALN